MTHLKENFPKILFNLFRFFDNVGGAIVSVDQVDFGSGFDSGRQLIENLGWKEEKSLTKKYWLISLHR
jgi:hypothetical protein